MTNKERELLTKDTGQNPEARQAFVKAVSAGIKADAEYCGDFVSQYEHLLVEIDRPCTQDGNGSMERRI